MLARVWVVANAEVQARNIDASVRDELERFEAEVKRHRKRVERGRRIMEARGRIIVTLIGLSRYEPRYEGVRAFVEDQWRSV
jgi:hypothetical protein